MVAWDSALGVSVALFVVYGAMHLLIGVLAPLLTGGGSVRRSW